MSEPKAAFPLKNSHGISARDYHASAFLASFLSKMSFSNLNSPSNRGAYIGKAFEMADLFIQESEKHK